jgi:hypothetical protein
MKVARAILSLYLISLLAACGTAGHYEFSTIFFGESLELRRDHTFSYSCGSDEIGNEYYATGTWAAKSPKSIVTTVVSGTGPATSCLAPVQVWSLSMKGFTADSRGNLLRRKWR